MYIGSYDDILHGGRGPDQFLISIGSDRIIDLHPQQGDRLSSKQQFQISTFKQGDDLMLIGSNHNLRTTLLNISLRGLLQYKPNQI